MTAELKLYISSIMGNKTLMLNRQSWKLVLFDDLFVKFALLVRQLHRE